MPLISPAHTQLAFSSKRSVEEGHPGKVSALRRRGTATSPANGEYPLGKRNKILARALPDDVKQYGEALLFWRKLNRCLRQKAADLKGRPGPQEFNRMTLDCMTELGYNRMDGNAYLDIIEKLPPKLREEVAASPRTEPYTADELDNIFGKLTPAQREQLGYGDPAGGSTSQFSSVQPGFTRGRLRLPKISREYLGGQLKANVARFAAIPGQMKGFAMGRTSNPVPRARYTGPMPVGRF